MFRFVLFRCMLACCLLLQGTAGVSTAPSLVRFDDDTLELSVDDASCSMPVQRAVMPLTARCKALAVMVVLGAIRPLGLQCIGQYAMQRADMVHWIHLQVKWQLWQPNLCNINMLIFPEIVPDASVLNYMTCTSHKL